MNVTSTVDAVLLFMVNISLTAGSVADLLRNIVHACNLVYFVRKKPKLPLQVYTYIVLNTFLQTHFGDLNFLENCCFVKNSRNLITTHGQWVELKESPLPP